jgi:hypothetical protein
MRPQHDGNDGRPSPQSQADAESQTAPFVPRSGDTSTFDRIGRIRQDRPEGKPGRHRLDASASRAAARSLSAAALSAAAQSPALPPLPGAGDVAAEPTAAAERAGDTAAEPIAAAEPAAWDLPLPMVRETPELPGLQPVTLTPEHLPHPPQELSLPLPPQELSLAQRDSVVPRQATPRPWWDLAQPSVVPPHGSRYGVEESWGRAAPPPSEPLPAGDLVDVWDSTEDHPAFSLAGKVASISADADVERFLSPAGPLTPGMRPVRALRSTAKLARFAALGLIALLGVAAVVSQPHGPNRLSQSSQSSQSLLEARNTTAADRSQERSAAPSPSSAASAQAQSQATPKTSATPKPTATATKAPTAAKLVPVAGLDQAQMTNAQTIVRTGRNLGVPSRGLLIGLMTAMQESNLYNLASQVLPESFNYPHQGAGADHDSCGLFQQRTSMGWGTVRQIMDPVYSSTKFFTRLLQVVGWQNMELTLAAQAVQGSAFPYAYAQHESRARTVLNALT